jgi:hypothetical protein
MQRHTAALLLTAALIAPAEASADQHQATSVFFVRNQTGRAINCLVRGKDRSFSRSVSTTGAGGEATLHLPLGLNQVEASCNQDGIQSTKITYNVSQLKTQHLLFTCARAGDTLSCAGLLHAQGQRPATSSATANGSGNSGSGNNTPPPATPATLHYTVRNQTGQQLRCELRGAAHAAVAFFNATQDGQGQAALPAAAAALQLFCLAGGKWSPAGMTFSADAFRSSHLLITCMFQGSALTCPAVTHPPGQVPPPIQSGPPPADNSGAPAAGASTRKLRVKSDFNRPILCQLFHKVGSAQHTVVELAVPAKQTRETTFVVPAVDQMEFHCKPTQGAGTWSMPKSRINNRDLGTRGVSGACYSGGTISCNAVMLDL